MQTVLNFPSLLQHTLIVGAYCSGKDFLASHAIKTIKQQRPSLKVYVIDIKGHPRESHYYANADFLRIKNSTNVATQEDVAELVSWIQHCFNEFESLEGEKLLVLSESTLVFHFFAQNKSNKLWLANKIISYLCLGNASGIYIWLIGTSFSIQETRISRQFWVLVNLLAIVHQENFASYNYLLSTDFLPKSCQPCAEEIRAIASQSPVKRAVYFNGEWLPMPRLDE
ncbi:hypothetical protein [Nostoc sp. FACHB-190]|uniref:hypothetical protein n=1 Tax=Nostoc sp. FACHB-190 TaxID=2692838 RepID=UPI001689FE4E|nr:hypothetical protein [Nostoc sp. FACHB-190]MBD2302864.1 hypothetical protein [Nostoc sp. FACHB-190]